MGNSTSASGCVRCFKPLRVPVNNFPERERSRAAGCVARGQPTSSGNSLRSPTGGYSRWPEVTIGTGVVRRAALLSGRYRPAKDERVAVLLCGANTTAVDFDR
jgi:hypothetical protein